MPVLESRSPAQAGGQFGGWYWTPASARERQRHASSISPIHAPKEARARDV